MDLAKPTPPGTLGVVSGLMNQSFDLAEFDDLLTCYLNFGEPMPSLFSGDVDFNFFSSTAEAPSTAQAFTPSVAVPPSSQITPPSASQPGSQAEKIEALQGLDDPAASQEQKAEDFEDIEKTPERSLDDDTKLSTLLTTPGSESSSKRKGKRAVRKKKKLL